MSRFSAEQFDALVRLIDSIIDNKALTDNCINPHEMHEANAQRLNYFRAILCEQSDPAELHDEYGPARMVMGEGPDECPAEPAQKVEPTDEAIAEFLQTTPMLCAALKGDIVRMTLAHFAPAAQPYDEAREWAAFRKSFNIPDDGGVYDLSVHESGGWRAWQARARLSTPQPTPAQVRVRAAEQALAKAAVSHRHYLRNTGNLGELIAALEAAERDAREGK